MALVAVQRVRPLACMHEDTPAECMRCAGLRWAGLRHVLQVPPGSLPRTMDVIMRHEAVESAKAGDKMVFSGQLVVVPDVSVISAPGEKVSVRGEGKRQMAGLAAACAVLVLLGAGVLPT